MAQVTTHAASGIDHLRVSNKDRILCAQVEAVLGKHGFMFCFHCRNASASLGSDILLRMR